MLELLDPPVLPEPMVAAALVAVVPVVAVVPLLLAVAWPEVPEVLEPAVPEEVAAPLLPLEAWVPELLTAEDEPWALLVPVEAVVVEELEPEGLLLHPAPPRSRARVSAESRQ